MSTWFQCKSLGGLVWQPVLRLPRGSVILFIFVVFLGLEEIFSPLVKTSVGSSIRHLRGHAAATRFFFLLVCLPVCLSRPLFLSVCYSETDDLRWAVYQIQHNWILIKYVYFEFCEMYTEMWSHSFETLIWSQNLQAPRKTSKPGRFHQRLYKSRGARPFSRNRMESFSDMMWTIELDQANQTSSLQLIIKPLYK